MTCTTREKVSGSATSVRGHLGGQILGRRCHCLLALPRLFTRAAAEHGDDEREDEQVWQDADHEHAKRLLFLARPHVHALLAQRGRPAVARLERQEAREVVELPPADRYGGLEAPLHLLPLTDLDGVDVALVELLGELGVGDVHRFLAAARSELYQYNRTHDLYQYNRT